MILARNSRIPYYAIVYSFVLIFLNTVALKPLADSVWAITLKLEFVAGFIKGCLKDICSFSLPF